jgi:hypothetical protein
MDLVVAPDGTVRAVYDETLDLALLGRLSIRRASHVEPTLEGHWQADLSPVSGPVLGEYDRRSEALEAERAWLEEHWLSPVLSGTHLHEIFICALGGFCS